MARVWAVQKEAGKVPAPTEARSGPWNLPADSQSNSTRREQSSLLWRLKMVTGLPPSIRSDPEELSRMSQPPPQGPPGFPLLPMESPHEL